MMKRLVIALVVLAVLAAPGVAALCEKCRGKMYTTDIGKCRVCGAATSSGAFKLCRRCSRELGECEHCRAPLGEAKAPAAEGARIDLHKSGDHNVDKWRYEYTIGAKGSRSERRSGKLTYDGTPIMEAEILDRISTPWGMMQYFGEAGPGGKGRWNSGWLLKKTYDQPIDPEKGRLLPSPETQAGLAAERVKRLKDDLGNFVLSLKYHGDQDKPFYWLVLSTRPLRRTAVYQFEVVAMIDGETAARVIDRLAESGVLGRAEDIAGDRDGLLKGPAGPCYMLHVNGARMTLQDNLGWGLPMLKHLDALRSVLEGDAADKMDLLLGRLSGLRKAWTEAEGKAGK